VFPIRLRQKEGILVDELLSEFKAQTKVPLDKDTISGWWPKIFDDKVEYFKQHQRVNLEV
jgi:hypothetical protein